ncbi:hypothetical protein SUGI_1460020 [Cryptomeria japonica]|uniref:Uncharacterized protein n=1 Tax=Cryptomeria japonica TaxID=3369 RepID=A0AAD3NV85_CRYJA|nr:hypothetical protein SUGI_1460020 [Cryptomeria japonica]
MATWRRNCMANTLMMLFLLTTILYNTQTADARRTLRHKYSAKIVHAKEELPEIKTVRVDESGLELNQRLSTSNHSPAVGHMQLTHPHHKMNTLKNKLPSGPSPGVGNAYINDGGVKRSGSILKNKLPSGGVMTIL